MNRFGNNWKLVAAVMLTAATAGATAHAQQTAATLPAKVAAANKASGARLEERSAAWRRRLASHGSTANLTAFGSAIASEQEKLTQGMELLAGPSGGRSRLDQLLAQLVVDDQVLQRDMLAEFHAFQEELIAESVRLYVAAGLDRKSTVNLFAYYRFKYAPPSGAFGPLLRKAGTLSQVDCLRTGVIWYGSHQLAKQLLPPEDDHTWTGFLGRLVADFAMSDAATELTDPGRLFAEQLEPEFKRAERELLTGDDGILTALRRVTDWHIATRNKQLLHHQGE
ncbi:hypothetical protein KOR34_01040 [Posidoniimonas corsicana]|uniref:Uncharacterized protein n=1 Tax=Posidoniimonas corsicana TaxID=1938618 RepID=A0A5C5V9C4_9BACT|nr:hypothetical protein [Posidoniimonas corsicana]TWT35216.1 hypothetical protein KOR34_01040 [Posidoniimonas corsicana]